MAKRTKRKPSAKTKGKARELQKQEFGDDAAEAAERIGEIWRKVRTGWKRTVADIINTGKALLAVHWKYGQPAKKLSFGKWGFMFQAGAVPKPLEFDQDTAGNLMTIASNPILTDPDNYRKLPAQVLPLYNLAKLPENILKAALQWDIITPEIKTPQVKRLGCLPDNTLKAIRESTVTPGEIKRLITGAKGQPDEPELWELGDLLKRARAFATKELRRCPVDHERMVGHALRAVSHEILTPLPQDVLDTLYSDYQALTLNDDAREHANFLSDRRLLISRILAAGGMKWTKDYERFPLSVFRGAKSQPAGGFGLVPDGKRGFDELAQLFAEELGKRTRDVARQMEHTLTTANPRRTRPTNRARLKHVDALIDNRALKTGLVPVYHVPVAAFTCTASHDEVVQEVAQNLAKELAPPPDHDDPYFSSPGPVGVFVEISRRLPPEVATRMRDLAREIREQPQDD